MTGVPGPFWPWRGSSAAEGVALGAVLFIVVALLPAGWWLLRRVYGRRAAGPLWPLLLFEVVALSYALVVPPWQTPDEPQHMAHVEVVRAGGFGAAEGLLPYKAPNARLLRVQSSVQREIVASMRETHAARWLPGGSSALQAGVVPGPPELNHPPLYYDVAAVVVRPFGAMPVVSRLAILRVLGVALAGCVVWCCGAAGRLLFPRKPWAEVPAAIALAVPTFAVFAGAVNNDSVAQLLAALLLLLLLAGVLERTRLARPLPWLGLIVLLVALGVLTKRTFVPLVPVILVAMAVRLRRHPRAMLAALAVVEATVGIAVATGAQPRLAGWHRATDTGRARCRDGHADSWAICLDPSSYQVSQKLALVDADELGDRDVRIALWTRGSNAALAVDLDSDTRKVAGTVEQVTPDWHPVVITGHVPAAPKLLSLSLTSRGQGRVSVDDVRLGPFEPNQPGANLDPAVDVPGPNYVVNGSGRAATLGAPTALPAPVRRVLDGAVDSADGLFRQPDAVIASAGIMARRAAQSFGSFWGTVGWQAPMPLFPVGLQWALAALVAGAAVGAGALVLRRGLTVAPASVLVAALVCVGAAAVLQSVPPREVEAASGRYLFPGLVAFTTLAAAGWRHLWPGSTKTYRAATGVGILVMHGLFVAIVLVPFLRR